MASGPDIVTASKRSQWCAPT